MSSVPVRAPVRRPAGPRTRPVEPERGVEAPERPRLRVVRAPARPRARGPFVLVCVGILLGALLAALVLNTSMAQTSFAIHDRQVALARLSEQQQELAQELASAASPGMLAARARDLGMVPAPPPAFLRLSDGAIIGDSVPAAATG